MVPKKEIKSEKKDIKPKEPDVGTDGKEKKIATKMYVSYLILLGLHRYIDYICGSCSLTAPVKKTAPSAAAKPKRGQSNLFASWGNVPKKSAEVVSESNSVCSPAAPFELLVIFPVLLTSGVGCSEPEG